MIVSVAELMPRKLPRPRPASPFGEPLLERLEHVDRRRVDALEDRDVEGDEVAEEHERHDALDGRAAARADPDDLRRLPGDELPGQLDARPDARVLVDVLE